MLLAGALSAPKAVKSAACNCAFFTAGVLATPEVLSPVCPSRIQGPATEQPALKIPDSTTSQLQKKQKQTTTNVKTILKFIFPHLPYSD